MIKTEIQCFTQNEQKEIERKLKETGYQKTADCMWFKIYRKGNIAVVLNREYF